MTLAGIACAILAVSCLLVLIGCMVNWLLFHDLGHVGEDKS